jgi:FAD/FMN-containing dehydrogenase
MIASQNALGQTYRRGEAGYEAARRRTLWNARLPDRYPDVIVQANNAMEVVAAVKAARRDGLRVTVRSGGHSWAGNHLRQGGMLLDVSRLQDVRIDAEARRATVGPGVAGHELLRSLARVGLFFPAGHCMGVCLGGYLLQGGFGWNGRVLGPACESVLGLDLVTADGELVHADEKENSDLYWAARGAGPGFFGVVTRFHLKLHPRPAVIGGSFHNYPIDCLEDVFRWAHAVGPEVPESVELQLVLSRDVAAVRGAGIMVLAPVFADSVKQARDDVAFLHECPARRKAALRVPFLPTGLELMYRSVMTHYPDDHRYAVDNMWTSAAFDDLLPGLRNIAETLPPAPSHLLWMNWAPPSERPSMAFSMEDDTYISLYSVWKDPKRDAELVSWPVDRMREMEHLATGCQLADENLGQRPARFVSDRNLARLDELRAKHDAQGRFHPWMGRP